MRLLGVGIIDDFVKEHADARKSLRAWQKIMETFPHADYVKGKTIFNVGGNKIRTITIVEYGISQAIVTHVLTHAEYDRNRWKD